LILLVLPTAQAFWAEVAATAESRALAPGLGLDTRFHAEPFHHKVRVFVGPSPLPVSPTAQAVLAEMAATPDSKVPPPGVGLGTCFHAVPFHRSISALSLKPEIVEPTAQALPAELAATPSRVALDSGLGLGTRFHGSLSDPDDQGSVVFPAHTGMGRSGPHPDGNTHLISVPRLSPSAGVGS
jgi:hypothetical protein